jgi:REP element-mobilizing transposase RayT
METLKPTICYHIYNHSNGFENVFNEPENYRYFLEKYLIYIAPIAETYAYCLMPNHFHLVVRMRNREVIEEIIRSKSTSCTCEYSAARNFTKVSFDFGKVTLKEKNFSDKDIEKFLSKQFSNLFSSYTQSYNKFHKRMGSLFIKNFKRVPLLDKNHFMNEVVYTHRNPIHHGFRANFDEWEFSSYRDIISGKSEIIELPKLLKMFGGKDEFIETHKQNSEKFFSKFISIEI